MQTKDATENIHVQSLLGEDSSHSTSKQLDALTGLVYRLLAAHQLGVQQVFGDWELHNGSVHASFPGIIDRLRERLVQERRNLELCQSKVELSRISNRGCRFVIAGVVTNQGSVDWQRTLPEGEVRLGAQVIAKNGAIVRELRWELPSKGGVGPKQSIPFLLPVFLEGLEPGEYQTYISLVLEGKFWFSSLGGGHAVCVLVVPPVASHQGIELTPATPRIERPVLCISVSGDTRAAVSELNNWRRDTALFTAGNLKRWVIVLGSGAPIETDGSLLPTDTGSPKTTLGWIRYLIDQSPDCDVVFITPHVSPSDRSWLQTLVQSAYSADNIAAAGGALVTQKGAFIDAGGTLMPSGYRHYFLPSGEVSSETQLFVGFTSPHLTLLRRDALESVGMLPEGHEELSLSLLEWSYRAQAAHLQCVVNATCEARVEHDWIDRNLFQSAFRPAALRERLLKALTPQTIEGCNHRTRSLS